MHGIFLTAFAKLKTFLPFKSFINCLADLGIVGFQSKKIRLRVKGRFENCGFSA